MQIGFNLPVSGPMATPEVMANTAQLGEALGFDYLTLTDHIALPDTSTPGYPYSTTGEFYSPDPGHRMEQLTAAAWVAAKTSKIRLVLAVMVVPHRPAVVAAKMLGHDRRFVRWTIGCRRRRRLAEGGDRGSCDHALRRTRRGDG